MPPSNGRKAFGGWCKKIIRRQSVSP